MAQTVSSRLINKAARDGLVPLGVQQKGRSRTWLDDHGWYLILIEFQPSGFEQGTYLNVGVNWLWNEKNYFSFDYGNRLGSFIRFESEQQFEQESLQVVARAVKAVEKYRKLFSSIQKSAKVLAEVNPKNGWALYHAAVSSGICGKGMEALYLFNSLIRSPVEFDWQRELNQNASLLITLVNDTDAFRNRVCTTIVNTRRQLNLKEWNMASFFD